MLLYPHSDANSDDDRLELLADPELSKRLRRANPKFFTRSGHGSIAKILALAGIVSLVAGYAIEPAVFATHRTNAPLITTSVQHVAPAPPHVLKHHAAAAPVVHQKPVIAAAPKVVVPVTEPVPQLQPKKLPPHRARAVAVAQPQVNAQNEEQFWLKAQAEARAKDRMRAKAFAVTAAAQSAAEDSARAQAPAKTPIDTGTPAKIVVPQPPVNAPRVPAPVSEPWPTLPGGGPCTPGRGPILVGGGLGGAVGGMIINSVLRNVMPVRHARPFGRP